jgi:hypothetical protein
VAPRPGSDHVLVLGLSKSGTTAVYETVRAGQRAGGWAARTLFEPMRAEYIDNLFRLAPAVPVVAKLTMDALAWLPLDPVAFDRRIMTVRDPRDLTVSMLIFRPLVSKVVRSLRAADFDRFLAALERKEADPESISVRELFELQTELGMGDGPETFMTQNLQRQHALLGRHRFHVLRYESYVEGRLDDLSAYLGYPVAVADTRTSTVFGHVARSMSAGAYRQWFREDDLAYFNTLFAPYLDALGYSRDAPLAEHPVVDPAESSAYVRARLRERQSRLEQRSCSGNAAWSPSDVTSVRDFEQLTDRARNGDAVACLRAAEVALAGHIEGTDEHTALRWARDAATLGSLPGVELTIELLGRLHGDDPALHRERRAWIVERQVRSEGVAQARAQRSEAELARVRSSVRYRLGSEIADAIQDPRRNGRRALHNLVELWRERRPRRS